MGDRYTINVDCAYCNSTNKDVWYAPTSNCDVFECVYCERWNFITTNFKAVQIEDVTYDMVEAGFMFTTSMAWTEDDIKRMCNDRFNKIKEMV